MEKRVVLIPRNLQLGDSIFRIEKHPLDEHANSVSKLKCYDLVSEEVTTLGLDPGKKGNMLINEKISVPMDGKLVSGEVGELIVNEVEAKKAIVKLIKEEIVKAELIVKTAKEELESVKENLNIFEEMSLNKKPTKVFITSGSKITKKEVSDDFVKEDD